MTDKYFGKLDLPNRCIPSIFLFNTEEFNTFMNQIEVNDGWVRDNAFIVEINEHLLLPEYQ